MMSNSHERKRSSTAASASPSRMKTPAPKSHRKLSWKKRIFFLFILYGLLFLCLEGALRVWKSHQSSEPKRIDGTQNDCDAIVFLCIGDSMTFGLGASSENSYPMRFGNHFDKHYSNTSRKVYNLGVPGTNTSEGMRAFKFFLQAESEVKADFALILYGINNRWNLHQATIWGWEETVNSEHALGYWTSHLQISKLVSIISENKRELVRRLSRAPGNRYRSMLDENGWDLFFASFQDELLAKWIRFDLMSMAGELKSKGIQPVFMTYHYERFGHLNDLIRETAALAKVPLIDLEENYQFFASREMLTLDLFHLNAKGYNFMAEKTAEGFGEIFSYESLQKILSAKQNDPKCGQRDKQTDK